MDSNKNLFQNIPSVDTCLRNQLVEPYSSKLPRQIVVDVIRRHQDLLRQNYADPSSPAPEWDQTQFFETLVQDLSKYEQGFLRRVINATGIIVHTNLGRSIFSNTIIEKIKEATQGYVNLEYDIEAGRRSSRYEHLVSPLCQLTGYEDSLIVNNNAAAVMLLLDTFAQGKEVLISRGELVEIGGGFRIPEVMKKAGAHLREVGCTNKTYVRDYERAITDRTAMIIKVHRSNFHMSGFTAEPTLAELNSLALEKGLYFMYDLGSGNILPPEMDQLIKEPSVAHCFRQGAQIVSFSGDKLLGGPQAGIILSSSEIIGILKKNQLLRALRVDKMCIAALEATLHLYLKGLSALKAGVPTVKMLTCPAITIKRRSQKVIKTLQQKAPAHLSFTLNSGYSQLGGGSLPEQQIPTHLIVLETSKYTASELDERLRAQNPPVIGRISEDRVLLDLRTVQSSEEKILIDCVLKAAS